MKIKPIILAAGMSSRFGSNKLLFGINGKMMYEHILFTVIELCKQDVFLRPLVVTQYDEIIEQLEQLPVDVICNPDSIRGISTSIAKGVNATKEECYYLFFTADQPYLTKDSIEKFVKGFLNSGKGLGCVCYGEVTGNPGIFSPYYKEQLLGLLGDVGGKTIINRYKEDAYFCQINEKELVDIDVIEEI